MSKVYPQSQFNLYLPTVYRANSAVQEIGIGLPPDQVTAMISRASLSVAYGESLSNMLQPFFLLIVMPIMGKGVNLQSRDIMGYLVLPFIIFFILQVLLVLYIPL